MLLLLLLLLLLVLLLLLLLLLFYYFVFATCFPPPWVEGEQSLDWLYTGAADAWGKWLSKESISNVLK